MFRDALLVLQPQLTSTAVQNDIEEKEKREVPILDRRSCRNTKTSSGSSCIRGTGSFTAGLLPTFSGPRRDSAAVATYTPFCNRLSGKTGGNWPVAMGERTPDGAQRLLYQAVWDEEAVRDELERFVAEQFGDPDDGIFVLDESGFPKKGTKSVGVKRQYCGAVGKIENCQVGVFVSYLSPRGHTFLDRRLYLPEPEWIEDQARRREAGVPEEIDFQTKAELARLMLEHAQALGVPGRWVTGDEVYGGDRKLRIWLELEHRPYVLGVRSNEKPWALTRRGPAQVTVSELAEQVPSRKWKRISAGEGSKGQRLYDWAWIPLYEPLQTG